MRLTSSVQPASTAPAELDVANVEKLASLRLESTSSFDSSTRSDTIVVPMKEDEKTPASDERPGTLS